MYTTVRDIVRERVVETTTGLSSLSTAGSGRTNEEKNEGKPDLQLSSERISITGVCICTEFVSGEARYGTKAHPPYLVCDVESELGKSLRGLEPIRATDPCSHEGKWAGFQKNWTDPTVCQLAHGRQLLCRRKGRGGA
jgi:hypothetical protein